MRQNHDQTQAELPGDATSGMQLCGYCQRYTPFTAAVQAGKPLNVICTCAIEQRAVDRFIRNLRLGATTGRVEGH